MGRRQIVKQKKNYEWLWKEMICMRGDRCCNVYQHVDILHKYKRINEKGIKRVNSHLITHLSSKVDFKNNCRYV